MRSYCLFTLVSVIIFLFISSALCEETSVVFVDFADQFLSEGEDPVWTDSSYKSQNIAIDISAMRAENSDVYVADIYVRTLNVFLRAYGGDEWGSSTVKMTTLAGNNNAILAMTGDSCQNFSAGWMIGNGVIERDTRNRKRDLCILYRTGEMVTLQSEEMNHEKIAAETELIWQTFLFGPTLLDEDGCALKDFSESNVAAANPRSALGYYAPGHYCFVQVDGRSTTSALESGEKNKGMTLGQLAAFMESIGCQSAYNLDGGRSSMLWFDDEVISTAADSGRRIGDIIMIKETK